MKKKNKEQKLFILFLLMLGVLNYPILQVFQINETVMGVPVSLVGIFIIWSLVIAISFIIINRN